MPVEWVALALEEIIANQREIKQNQELILERLDEFKTQLIKLGKQIDEQTLVEFRTGMRCLIAGHSSDLETIRDKEFDRARGIFSRLISLDPAGTTKGTSGAIGNPFLICFGYWGSFEYFTLLGDYRNAMIHAYECTAAYPEITSLGLDLFPSKLFSKDYATCWRKTLVQLEDLEERCQEQRAKNAKKNRSFYVQHAKRVGAAGAAGAAGAGLAVVVGALTFGVAGGVVAAAGLRTAKQVWDSIRVAPPAMLDVESLEAEIERLIEVRDSFGPELVKECETRKAELQTITVREFGSLSTKSIRC